MTILGPKKRVSSLAASHLQHWAILLSAHKYTIEFKANITLILCLVSALVPRAQKIPVFLIEHSSNHCQLHVLPKRSSELLTGHYCEKVMEYTIMVGTKA